MPQKQVEKTKPPKQAEKIKPPKQPEKVKPPKQIEKTKLMISIVNRGDDEKLADALSEETRLLHYSFLGKGTARSNILDYFGLTSVEKRIVVTVIPESMERRLLTIAVETLKLYLVGNGIAFTIPLTSVSALIANAVTSGIVGSEKHQKGEKMKPIQYELIAAVYNLEYSDTVIEAARGAGAVGGTLINARTLSSNAVEEFVGAGISHESEILLVVTEHERRNEIMRAIREVAGLKTQGKAIVLSLPVDALVGIGTISDEYRQKEEDVQQ